MNNKFHEYKELNLPKINKEILTKWNEEQTFLQSLSSRKGKKNFVFYEGPPSANGLPGIHHVMARTIKDIFCRYKTLQGYYVERKGGWDTHGLPVELEVEKKLGITKDDIGKKISIENYNKECRKSVMRYTDAWEELTKKMGYWVDMKNPYITYDNRYIESVWWLLKQLYDKGCLYKGYSIQPYSPSDGTGLSSHELNLPGCYKDIKDTTVVAMFKIVRDDISEPLFSRVDTPMYFLAWTTTPWTLPSNTALAVGKKIKYLKIRTLNPYTAEAVTVICAKDLYKRYFAKENKVNDIQKIVKDKKNLLHKIIAEVDGKAFENVRYEQLMPYQQPETGDAFKVLIGDFITTNEGTGIVHIAPSFGSDDFRIAQKYGIGSLTLVDKKGKFIEGSGDLSGKYVKNEYDDCLTSDDETTDVYIAVKLKAEGKAFKIEKYVHAYPHSWRTDKPILYYPMDAWFIKTTAVKEHMIELNKTINWKPKSTGEGRFGKWLENLVDWNLSRSRFWGTPLPIWISKDKKEQKCIGSVMELKTEIEKAVEAGFMSENPLKAYRDMDGSAENYQSFDLHKPYVDNIILCSNNGKRMYRETDLIDVWFDSGAMPYAQYHYPFSLHFKSLDVDFPNSFPADYIAEGVDQTRGWFFTLHAIAVMLFESVAFKNIISNGLVLDAKGNKMSKRLGNAIDPFKSIDEHGSDALRWYMITNAQPWDNLKFDMKGVDEVKRKFFGTLYNTYNFFALYANIDGFNNSNENIPYTNRPEIDRWILSQVNTLILQVTDAYENYEPTQAGRLIQHFTIENLSNWFVRLSRKRFWGGEYNDDKVSAYQTLFNCLKIITLLASPIAPFYMDKMYRDLHQQKEKSVHLATFPTANNKLIDKDLENRMILAQKISSMVLGLRRKIKIKVRQPLQKILIPVLQSKMTNQLNQVKYIILNETNVKEMEYIDNTERVLVKKIKPDFKKLGPRFGKHMKIIAGKIHQLEQEEIAAFEEKGEYIISTAQKDFKITLDDVEIISKDIPGWLVATEGNLTVALDIHISEKLRQEGIAREFVNRIQNLRKNKNFEVTDKIELYIKKHPAINEALINFKPYILNQTLAVKLDIHDVLPNGYTDIVKINTDISTQILVKRFGN